jgi:hypothetical protein
VPYCFSLLRIALLQVVLSFAQTHPKSSFPRQTLLLLLQSHQLLQSHHQNLLHLRGIGIPGTGTLTRQTTLIRAWQTRGEVRELVGECPTP